MPSIQPRDSRQLLDWIVPHSEASPAPQSMCNLAHLMQFSSSTCQKQTDRKCLCQMRGRVSEEQERSSDLCRPKTGRWGQRGCHRSEFVKDMHSLTHTHGLTPSIVLWKELSTACWWLLTLHTFWGTNLRWEARNKAKGKDCRNMKMNLLCFINVTAETSSLCVWSGGVSWCEVKIVDCLKFLSNCFLITLWDLILPERQVFTHLRFSCTSPASLTPCAQ